METNQNIRNLPAAKKKKNTFRFASITEHILEYNSSVPSELTAYRICMLRYYRKAFDMNSLLKCIGNLIMLPHATRLYARKVGN